MSAIDQDAVDLFAAEDPGVEGAALISDQRTEAIEEMEKMRYWITLRGAQKTMHKAIVAEIKAALQQHAEGTRLPKHDLNDWKQEIIEAYNTALRHHQAFIKKTKLPEDKLELCVK